MSPLGIVSNCWWAQLDAGAKLTELIAEAARRGYRAVELRQTCLGEFETGADHLPIAETLSVLPEAFPGVRLNVAVNVPFLRSGFSAQDRVFSAGKWAAQAVAGEYPPHLRLVDLTTTAAEFSAAAPESAGNSIAELVRAVAELDGVLSLEQSRQPWDDFRRAFDAARRELALDAQRLRLCYDPCNLLFEGGAGLCESGTTPAAVTASLAADELSMVHVKQLRDGRGLPEVTDGDVDWTAQAKALSDIGYRGPILFEVEPHENVWDNLLSSGRYLRDAGFDIDLESLQAD